MKPTPSVLDPPLDTEILLKMNWDELIGMRVMTDQLRQILGEWESGRVGETKVREGGMKKVTPPQE